MLWMRQLTLSALFVAACGCASLAQPPSGGAAAPPPGGSDTFLVKLETSKGDIVLEVHPEWAPLGAAQFKAAVQDGVYDDARFFRVIDGFMAQFGIPGDPKKAAVWNAKRIKDEPVKQKNTRGMVTYAMGGPNSRTTQLFISFKDNSRLDADGFAPFAKVVTGMDVVDKLYKGYGEGAPNGSGPDQGRVQSEGNAYLNKTFPRLDYIKKATIVESAGGAAAGPPPQ